MIVHQIFGLLGDTEMNDLFKKNSLIYQEFCKKNNYEYHLWNKEECEELLKDYEDYRDFYYSVKYDIMKVDIMRFLILHKYGGLYADLDTEPLIKTLKGSTLIFAYKTGPKREHYEIEIIQSIKGHPYLLQFLDYAQTQIKEKDKIDIYKSWKMRYVYQTTGPYSANRFLKNLDDVDTYIINEPLTRTGENNLTGKEDFISYVSLSYKDKM
jgi:mannosyltransferase OCH1-like enzyme